MRQREEKNPSSPAPMPSQVTEPELTLLKQLQADVLHAQGVLNRYGQVLAQKYQLGAADTLNTNSGAIGRQSKDAA